MSADAALKKMDDAMAKGIQALQRELVKVRTGRASTALLDGIHVDYYGSSVPINQVANVTTPDARTLQVVPWEGSTLGAIEKAILAANIGLTPQSDGKLIRISIPLLTEDRRKEMVKTVKKIGEEAKIAVRTHRRDANEDVKKLEKDKVLTQDDVKKAMDQIQKKTDQKSEEIDKLILAKEKEIMTV